MTRTRVTRTLLSAALLALGLAVPVIAATPAHAVVSTTSPSLTVGIVGYGKVTASGMTDCVSPETNAGITSSGGGGTEYDCPTVDPTNFEQCLTTNSPDGDYTSCWVTLTAAAIDPSGWAFDHWSGSCSGTSATCTVVTEDGGCDYSGLKPVCNSTAYAPKAVAVFKDIRPPVTQITAGPGDHTTNWSDDDSVTFTFANTNEPGEIVRSECEDETGGGFAPCTSPVVRSSLIDGLHDFCVRQYDASGLVGNVVCHGWDQEKNVIESMDVSPNGDTTDSNTTIHFSYSSNKDGRSDGTSTTFTCAIDSGAPGACPSILTGMPNGHHTVAFFVHFTPLYGATRDSGPLTYSWNQDDEVAPKVTFNLPSGRVGTTAPTLGYSLDDPNAVVTCIVDGTEASCDHHAAVLPTTNGVHGLLVTATDAAGNSDTYKWTWDKENAPVASILSGPAEKSRVVGHTTTFRLQAPAADTTLACKLDAGSWTPCATTKSLTGLAYGAHTFSVQATYHSTLGSTLAGPIVVRHWSMIAPAHCSIRIVPRTRLHRATFTINCNRTGTMAITAQVRIGARTRLLVRGTVPVTSGRSKTFSRWTPDTTWNRMVRGHRYRAYVQVHSGRTIIGRGTTLIYR